MTPEEVVEHVRKTEHDTYRASVQEDRYHPDFECLACLGIKMQKEEKTEEQNRYAELHPHRTVKKHVCNPDCRPVENLHLW